MPHSTSPLLVRYVRELADAPGSAASPDGELVERFAGRGDGEAFAEIVRRHGAMVLDVCRRILRHDQDAEDVFQAVFLVLSRRAWALRRKEAVGPWLFGVAHRLALRARQKGRWRQAREPRAPEGASGDPADELTVREVQVVLDEELARLPERERGPLVLCYLEGMTRDEAARRLGCPLGTLKSRLERARAVLQKRLSRRGLGLPAALAMLLLPRVPASGVPPALQIAVATFALRPAPGGAVPPAVAELAEGMLRPTLVGKLAAAAFLGIVACGIGAGVAATKSGERPEPGAPAVPIAARPETGTGRMADPPPEKQEAEPLPAVVNGVAKAVDAGRGTLLVAHRDGEDTFTVANGAAIEIDGKPGELARLPAGANVALTRFVGSKTAGSVQATGRSYFGNRVTAVDARKGTITVRDREDEKTFAVARDALIWVDGKGAELAAVPPGAFVNLNLAADQQTVRDIGADGPSLGGCGGSLVVAVDVPGRAITFDEKAAPDVAGKTFAVAADALVTINGNKKGTLSDVPVGCCVNLLLRVDGRTVGHVYAQGPSNLCELGGSVVKAVDTEKGTITFDDGAGTEVAGKTFTLAKDAVIAIDGKPGKLSALPPGSYVEMRLWVDRQTVGSLHTSGQPVPGVGVVKAVDGGKNLITVGDRTYPVAKDANIVIDGKPVGLAEVPVGAHVALKLNVDRKTVGTIFHVKP
jgi:RNA polymerase sigma factor (sigma-70 family)